MTVGILRSGEREFTTLSALVTFPLRGIWSARIELDADEDNPLAPGPATLELVPDNSGESTKLTGTITEVDASTFEGRATAFMVAGAGKLATTILDARTYQQAPFAVPIASIATDAVTDAGEDFDDDVALALLAAPRWHRVASTAAQLLDRLAELFGFSWRMNDDGFVVFAIDEWLAADEEGAGLYLESGENAQDRTIAGTIARASIRPGSTVRGRRIEEVHYLLDGDGLRVLMRWGDGTGPGGFRGDLETATRRAMPLLAYSRVHEVTVRRQLPDGTLDVEADDAAVGGVTAVPYYPGVIGCRMAIPEGTRACLAFLNGDEIRPAILGFERFVPNPAEQINDYAVARANDPVGIGSMTFAAVAGPGGIASIAITYTPQVGPPQVVTVLPGVPVTLNFSGQIQAGSTEVFLRADP